MVRDVLARFRERSLTAGQAAELLGLSRSGMYRLYTGYLRAAAEGSAASFGPAASGGGHAPAWPPEVAALLRRWLTASPAYSYAFAASEAARLCGFRLDRSQVRLWAIREGIAGRPRQAQRSCTRRWQRDRVGELFQMDATPYRWFGADGPMMPMINMLDDCSRFQTGGRIYRSENHAAYLHFLESAFRAHGLPLQIYVDHASVVFSGTPGSVTRLQADLLFYGVTFLYAPTPQAKGKTLSSHARPRRAPSRRHSSPAARNDWDDTDGIPAVSIFGANKTVHF